MRSTFRILFYVNRSKERKGMVPIMGRITINGTKACFSCKYLVEKQLWSNTRKMVMGNSAKSVEINNMLEVYRTKIATSYQMLLLKNRTVTAAMVKEEFLGTGNEYATLMKTIENHIKLFSLRVGKERSVQTLKKMQVVQYHLKEYLKYQYKTKDILLIELDEMFILNYLKFLKEKRNLSQSSIWVYCTFLKKIIKEAYNNGTISVNPFKNIKLKPDVGKREFLTQEDMKKLLDYTAVDPKLELIADSFIFSCFTGLSFIDLKNLTSENLLLLNNEMWIITNRKKNSMPCQIKLLKIPLKLLMKYNECKNVNIFNLPSYETALNRLKTITAQCGIKKNVTFHCARHTFATMALTNGMPIESISKILGHSNISTTQIYAKIINQKLCNDFTLLDKKIDKLFYDR